MFLLLIRLSYKIAVKNSTQLTKTTFKAAYESREPKNGLIFHSDRSANYISTTFQKHLASYGVIQSFSNPGTPYDNSVIVLILHLKKALSKPLTNTCHFTIMKDLIQ